MTIQGQTTHDDSATIAIARELGMFDQQTLAALSGRSATETADLLQMHPTLFEPVDARRGEWRLTAAQLSPAVQAPPMGQAAAAKLAAEAKAALAPVERGSAQSAAARALAIQLAEQRIEAAQAAASATADPSLRNTLAKTRNRARKLAGQGQAAPDGLLEGLRDWTIPLGGGGTSATPAGFPLEQVLRKALREAGQPGAVYAPASAALAANVAGSPDRPDLVTTLDHELRLAGVRGQIFQVLALGCVASITAAGALADSLLGVLTTPAFRHAADRTSLRLVYTALASLARPGTQDAGQAAEACAYMMRRQPPGRDEMELLAPAALQCSATDSQAALTLIAQWLTWEQGQSDATPESPLPHLGHVARNLGCAFDTDRYASLQRSLPKLADDDLGVVLVTHLCDRVNEALELRPGRPDAGLTSRSDRRQHYVDALARSRVARVTDPERARPHTQLELPARSKVTDRLEALALLQRLEEVRPQDSFSSHLRRRAPRDV